jgi:hypothetical protein
MAQNNAEWEYKQWCEEYELNEDTIALLDKHGFMSYRALANMPENMFKRLFKDLIAGQQVLLKEAINILRPPPPTPLAGRQTRNTLDNREDRAQGEGVNKERTGDGPSAANTATIANGAPAINGQLFVNDLVSMWGDATGLNAPSAQPKPVPCSPRQTLLGLELVSIKAINTEKCLNLSLTFMLLMLVMRMERQ